MGIPKLSQDFQQFAERVVLGNSEPEIETERIQSLIIDGPSLVYLVYHRLLSFKLSLSPKAADAVPTYSEINATIQHLLLDFEKHAVEIKKIYFDGGLPAHKQKTRVERLESLTRQLIASRQIFPSGFEYSRATQLQSRDCESALWQCYSPSHGAASSLPPPFMVASAIEDLKSSKWVDIVEVCPGEADPYCAVEARRWGCGILSNDSDMVVHNLGDQGCVVLLQSLEKLSSEEGVDITRLAANSLSPASISRRLNISSIIRLAFERNFDASVSFATILHRAKDQSRALKLHAQYEDFASQYGRPQIDGSNVLSIANFGLDPRVGELVVQVCGTPDSEMIDEKWHMYLPPLFEDPSRDAAWSYGTAFRQVAYSVLQELAPPGTARSQVHEFHRRGNRIAGVSVGLPSIQNRAIQIRHIFGCFRDYAGEQLDAFPVLTRWRLFALREVHRQRLLQGKTVLLEDQVYQQLSPDYSKFGWPWEDIHLNGCIQAVLYSVRMLKQIILLPFENIRIENLVELRLVLESLPKISELMVDPHQLVMEQVPIQAAFEYVMHNPFANGRDYAPVGGVGGVGEMVSKEEGVTAIGKKSLSKGSGTVGEKQLADGSRNVKRRRKRKTLKK